jgi:hypothetical protein
MLRNCKDSLQPYHPECTQSLLISEAKQDKAELVIGHEKFWRQKEIQYNSLHTRFQDKQ